MRVTTNSYSENLLAQLQQTMRSQVALQRQISSGQRVQSADDDPAAMQQLLKLRDESAKTEQFQENIQLHQETSNLVYSSIRSLKQVLDRAQEIAFSADGLDSPQDLQTYAAEVTQLIKRGVEIANQSHRGEYLFSGTNSRAPFTVNEGAGGIISVDYHGNSEQRSTEVAAGALVTSSVPGANQTGAGERGVIVDSSSGADLFTHLVTLQKKLASGDIAGISSDVRPQLEDDEENLLYHLGNNAALQARLENSLNEAKDRSFSLEKSISARADIDLTDAIVRLNQTQTSYQAALQSAGAMLNLTLLDYLR
jgi:flagellar hook-associated protein 3 FlgL